MIGKISSLLPSFKAEMGKSILGNSKIYINESLTNLGKKLFGRVNAFKQQHDHNFLWTANGKNLLRETETSRILSFYTHEEFENYLYENKNYLTVLFFIVIVKCLKYVYLSVNSVQNNLGL